MPPDEDVSEAKEERDRNIQGMLKEVSNENALYLASLTEEERMIEMQQCAAVVKKLRRSTAFFNADTECTHLLQILRYAST